jgi:hypothetical protein
MNKEEQESKKDIAKRLRLSNEKLWNYLSNDKQNLIINEYYNSLDIEHIGIHGVLENIRNINKDFGFIIIGLLLGFLGNVASNIFIKYIPIGIFADILLGLAFVLLIYFCSREIRKLNVEQLRDYKVLEYFVGSIKKNDI